MKIGIGFELEKRLGLEIGNGSNPLLPPLIHGSLHSSYTSIPWTVNNPERRPEGWTRGCVSEGGPSSDTELGNSSIINSHEQTISNSAMPRIPNQVLVCSCELIIEEFVSPSLKGILPPTYPTRRVAPEGSRVCWGDQEGSRPLG
jgi:hypothetical protein